MYAVDEKDVVVELPELLGPDVGAPLPRLAAGEHEASVTYYVVLTEGRHEVGTHRFAFGGSGLPLGVYLVRAETPGEGLTRRITLVR